jgi:hypothetical protein
MQTIIFGTRRLGKSDEAQTNEKYPGEAVITVEAAKEGGRSRRILFNKTAGELLNLESGANQLVTFGTATDDVKGYKSVLVANADLIEGGSELNTYRTSKNPAYFENTKEKGKSIPATSFSKELTDFLGLDDNVEHEFRVSPFNEMTKIESFKLELIVEEKEEFAGLADGELFSTEEDSRGETLDEPDFLGEVIEHKPFEPQRVGNLNEELV